MHTTSNSKRVNHPGVDVLGVLNDMPEPEKRNTMTTFDQVATKWANRLLVASGVLLGLLALLAGIHGITPLPRALLIGALGLGVSVQLLALAALLLLVVSSAVSGAMQFRRMGQTYQEEMSHDYEMASRLASYPVETLEAADRWIEQKVKRLERRQVRFFGGSDKLALAVVMVAGWTAWKEVGGMLLSWEPSPVLFGSALLLGLAIGGMVVSRMVDRLAYQRDVLQIAKSLAAEQSVSNAVPRLVPSQRLVRP